MKKISTRLTALFLTLAMLATMVPTSFAAGSVLETTTDVLSGSKTGTPINGGTLAYDSGATDYPITYQLQMDASPIGQEYQTNILNYSKKAFTTLTRPDGTEFASLEEAKEYVLSEAHIKGTIVISFEYDAEAFPNVTLSAADAQAAFVADNPDFDKVFIVDTDPVIADGKVTITVHTIGYDKDSKDWITGTEVNPYADLLGGFLTFNTPKDMFGITAADFETLSEKYNNKKDQGIDGKVDASGLTVNTSLTVAAFGVTPKAIVFTEKTTNGTSFSFGGVTKEPDPADGYKEVIDPTTQAPVAAVASGEILVDSPMNMGAGTSSNGVIYLNKDGKLDDDTAIDYTLKMDASQIAEKYQKLKESMISSLSGRTPEEAEKIIIAATKFPEGSSYTFKLTPADTSLLKVQNGATITWADDQTKAKAIFEDPSDVQVVGDSIVFTVNVHPNLAASVMETQLNSGIDWLKDLKLTVKNGLVAQKAAVEDGSTVALNGEMTDGKVLIGFQDIPEGLTAQQIIAALRGTKVPAPLQLGAEEVGYKVPLTMDPTPAVGSFTAKIREPIKVTPSIIVNTAVVPGTEKTGTLYVFPTVADSSKYELPTSMETINYTLGLNVANIKTRFDALVAEQAKEATRIIEANGGTVADEDELKAFIIGQTKFPEGEMKLTLTPDARLTTTGAIAWSADADTLALINAVFDAPQLNAAGTEIIIPVKKDATASALNELLTKTTELQLKTAYKTDSTKVAPEGTPITDMVILEGDVSGYVTTTGFEGTHVSVPGATLQIDSTENATGSFAVEAAPKEYVQVKPSMVVNTSNIVPVGTQDTGKLQYHEGMGDQIVDYLFKLDASSISTAYKDLVKKPIAAIQDKAPDLTEQQVMAIINNNTYFTQGGLVVTFNYDADLELTGSKVVNLSAPGVDLSELFGNPVVDISDTTNRKVTITIPIKEVTAKTFNPDPAWMSDIQMDLTGMFKISETNAKKNLDAVTKVELTNGDVTGSVGLTFSDKVNTSGEATPQSIIITSTDKASCEFGVEEATVASVKPYILVEDPVTTGKSTSFMGEYTYSSNDAAKTVNYTLGLDASGVKDAYEKMIADAIKMIDEDPDWTVTDPQKVREMIVDNTSFKSGTIMLNVAYDPNVLTFVPTTAKATWKAPTGTADITTLFEDPTVAQGKQITVGGKVLNTINIAVDVKSVNARVMENLLKIDGGKWIENLQISLTDCFTATGSQFEYAYNYCNQRVYLQNGKVSGQVDLKFSDNIHANGMTPPVIVIVSEKASTVSTAGSGDPLVDEKNTYHLSADANADADAYFTVKKSADGGGGGGGGGGTPTYTLTFETNGGSTINKLTNQKKDTVVDLSTYTPTRDGFTFEGWYSDKDLTNKVTSVTLDANKTVYAKWIKNPSLNTEDHYAYIIGYSDGTVRPTKNITRAEAATIFFRLLSQESRADYWTKDNDFTDITDKTVWYNNAVSTMQAADIITGYPDHTFGANKAITRGEFAAIVARFDKGQAIGTANFNDISDHWARDYITRAAELGWINGYTDGSFKPNQPITRAEAVMMINRVLGRNHVHSVSDMLPDMNTWTDNTKTTVYYYYDMQEATNSHDYEIATVTPTEEGGDTKAEKWTAMMADPDWKALEEAMSSAGDVVADIAS